MLRSAKHKFIFLCSVIALIIVVTLTKTQHIEAVPTSNAIEIALIGDFGGDTVNQQDVADLFDDWDTDYIVTVGDNRYGIGDLDRAVGKYYCEYLKNATAGTNCPSGGNANVNRFFPTVGNHDYSDGNGLGDYLNYFQIPGVGANSTNTSGTELYYDFKIGSVHFFSINSEVGDDETSDQAQWLAKEMQRSTSRWQIVLMHRSTYASATRTNRGGYMRWPFEAWGADAVINGDDHFYERLAIGNIPYFITGTGGMSLHAWGTIYPASIARDRTDYGALRLQVTESQLIFGYYTEDGRRRDTLTLPQPQTHCRKIGLPTYYDTWLNANDPGANYGNASVLELDGSPGQVVLMRWEMSEIPVGAVLQANPILTLDHLNTSSNQYEIYEMDQWWSESEATWNKSRNGLDWPDSTAAFSERGALLGRTPGTHSNRDNITLNATGKSTVQGWINRTQINRGILLADLTNATDGNDFYQHSLLTLQYCAPFTTNLPIVFR